ncbi:MAG TPA: phosphatidylinositol-specific phospholipase C domain-containing protein [Archangium sp.]|nr:phosphatidylinositol-specific phospholipase C domain-containing protein [Archangium sp.]
MSSQCLSSRAVSFVLFFFALLTPVHFAAAQGQAFNDAGSISAHHPTWMSVLPNSISLAALSLPGTHDTMARVAPGAVTGAELSLVLTQSLGLRAQLDAGIRVLDIRARHIGNAFTIHHGPYYLAANFDEVLGTAVQFLQEHPSETILMRLKEEHEPESNTRSFIDTFKAYRDQPSYDRSIWRGTTVPALGQVRGKIVILDEFSRGVYGIRWGALDIQDAYTQYDTAAKWNLVREHFARTDAGGGSNLYVNFSSATCADFWDYVFNSCDPRSVAQGVNPSILHHLAGGHVHNTGALRMDFPGAGLIDAIIARNLQHLTRHFRTGDYNGDGRTDWSWYAPWSKDFIVMLSDDQGGFSPRYNATYSLFGDWAEAQFFSTGDFNGDGLTDWSWYAPWSQDFIVMKSTGQGGFSPDYIRWSSPVSP